MTCDRVCQMPPDRLLSTLARDYIFQGDKASRHQGINRLDSPREVSGENPKLCTRILETRQVRKFS